MHAPTPSRGGASEQWDDSVWPPPAPLLGSYYTSGTDLSCDNLPSRKHIESGSSHASGDNVDGGTEGSDCQGGTDRMTVAAAARGGGVASPRVDSCRDDDCDDSSNCCYRGDGSSSDDGSGGPWIVFERWLKQARNPWAHNFVLATVCALHAKTVSASAGTTDSAPSATESGIEASSSPTEEGSDLAADRPFLICALLRARASVRLARQCPSLSVVESSLPEEESEPSAAAAAARQRLHWSPPDSATMFQPQARIVSMHEFSAVENWFVFCSNSEGPKASELAAAGGHAAAVFQWPEIGKQVRFSGFVVPAARSHSARLFAQLRPVERFYFEASSRGREHPFNQSQVIASNEVRVAYLRQSIDAGTARLAGASSSSSPQRTSFSATTDSNGFGGMASGEGQQSNTEIALPPAWSGFCFIPHTIEFLDTAVPFGVRVRYRLDVVPQTSSATAYRPIHEPARSDGNGQGDVLFWHREWLMT